MGHYDSCYEADERRHDERHGIEFKAAINKLTDERAGQLRDIIEEVFLLGAAMSGNADQHRSMQRYKEIIKKELFP